LKRKFYAWISLAREIVINAGKKMGAWYITSMIFGFVANLFNPEVGKNWGTV